jgi:predicted NBD/HSP70 family sugar kinase
LASAGEKTVRKGFRSARSAVIAALLRHEQLSRSALSEITGVSNAAITDVSQGFLQSGLLVELAPKVTEKRRGRPMLQLALQPSHAYFVGIDVAESATLMVITDLRGRVLERQSIPFCATPEKLVVAVRTAFLEILKSTALPRNRVWGVGITVTGIVDAEAGVCRYSAALNWHEVPIAHLMSEGLGLPAWVDNDANAVAVGEKFFGYARDYQHFTSIVLGRTIGAAHYMHDMLYRGYDGGAGEIGHITMDPNGALCRCGRNGCLDTISGGAALREAAAEAGIPVAGMHELEELAVQGNPTAARLLRHAGNALGTAVASLVHVTNPQCVLFTDMEGFENGVFRTATRQAIENNILPRFLGSTQIIFSDADLSLLPRSAASIAALEYLTSL